MIPGVSSQDLGLECSEYWVEAQRQLLNWRRRSVFEHYGDTCSITDGMVNRPLSLHSRFLSTVSPALLPQFQRDWHVDRSVPLLDAGSVDFRPLNVRLGTMFQSALKLYDVSQANVLTCRCLEMAVTYLPVKTSFDIDLLQFCGLGPGHPSVEFLQTYRRVYHGTSLPAALSVIAQGWRPSLQRDKRRWDPPHNDRDTGWKSMEKYAPRDRPFTFAEQLGKVYTTTSDRSPLTDYYQCKDWLHEASELHTGEVTARLCIAVPWNAHLHIEKRTFPQYLYLPETVNNILGLQITRHTTNSECERAKLEHWYGAPTDSGKLVRRRKKDARKLNRRWGNIPGVRANFHLGTDSQIYGEPEDQPEDLD